MKIENSRINEMQWRMVNHEAIKEFDTSSLPDFDGCSEGLEFEDNIESVTKHVILLFQGDSEVSLGYIATDKDMPYEDKFFSRKNRGNKNLRKGIGVELFSSR